MTEDVVTVWEACEDGPVMRLVAREQWEALQERRSGSVLDVEGRNVFVNTHFAEVRDAWARALKSADARCEQAVRGLRSARAAERKAEQECAEALEQFVGLRARAAGKVAP